MKQLTKSRIITANGVVGSFVIYALYIYCTTGYGFDSLEFIVPKTIRFVVLPSLILGTIALPIYAMIIVLITINYISDETIKHPSNERFILSATIIVNAFFILYVIALLVSLPFRLTV